MFFVGTPEEHGGEDVEEVGEGEFGAGEEVEPAGLFGEFTDGAFGEIAAEFGAVGVLDVGGRVGSGDGFEGGSTVFKGFVFFNEATTGQPLQKDVVATVGKLLFAKDTTDAEGGVNLGVGGVVFGFVAGLEESHCDESGAAEGVGGHHAITRLEDVEGEDGFGEQDGIGQGEEGDPLGPIGGVAAHVAIGVVHKFHSLSASDIVANRARRC